MRDQKKELVVEKIQLKNLLCIKRMAEIMNSHLKIGLEVQIPDYDEEAKSDFSEKPHLEEVNPKKNYSCNIFLMTNDFEDGNFKIWWMISGLCTFKPPQINKKKRVKNEVDLTNQRLLPDFYEEMNNAQFNGEGK